MSRRWRRVQPGLRQRGSMDRLRQQSHSGSQWRRSPPGSRQRGSMDRPRQQSHSNPQQRGSMDRPQQQSQSGSQQQLHPGSRQRGVALVVALILLLVTSFVGFSAMETSRLQGRMATAMHIQEQTFQAAEAAIEMTLDDAAVFAQARDAAARGDSWPTRSYSLGQDGELTAESTVRFLAETAAEGHSIRHGSSAVATRFYEVEATARRRGNRFVSVHVQGVYREEPDGE